MIKKNTTFGKIKGVTVIELGSGDVKIGSVFDPANSSVGIIFKNIKTTKVRTKFDDVGKTTDEIGLDAIITINDLGSLVVLKSAIEQAEETLLRIKHLKDNKEQKQIPFKKK